MVNVRSLIVLFMALAALAAPGCGAKKPVPTPVHNSAADNVQRINADQSLTPEQRQAALRDAQGGGASSTTAK